MAAKLPTHSPHREERTVPKPTEPKAPRVRRDPAEKAKGDLERAESRVTRAEEKLANAQEQVTHWQAEYDKAVAYRDYVAANPDLPKPDDEDDSVQEPLPEPTPA